MEAPPPYMPPRRKSNTGLIVGIVIGAFALCCILPAALLGGGALWFWKKVGGTAECVLSYQDLGKALRKYEAEHDGKLPSAATWQDDLREDYRASMTPKDQRSFVGEMSPDGDWGCKEESGMTGMAFNDDYSGKKVSSIKDDVSAIVIFETEHPSRNQHAKYKPLDSSQSPKVLGKPRGWYTLNADGRSYMDTPRKGRIQIQTGGDFSGN